MIGMRRLIRFVLEPRSYLWIDVVLVKETPKAILIIFDGRNARISKAWIVPIKRNTGGSIKIKISDYNWSKKIA